MTVISIAIALRQKLDLEDYTVYSTVNLSPLYSWNILAKGVMFPARNWSLCVNGFNSRRQSEQSKHINQGVKSSFSTGSFAVRKVPESWCDRRRWQLTCWLKRSTVMRPGFQQQVVFCYTGEQHDLEWRCRRCLVTECRCWRVLSAAGDRHLKTTRQNRHQTFLIQNWTVFFRRLAVTSRQRLEQVYPNICLVWDLGVCFYIERSVFCW